MARENNSMGEGEVSDPMRGGGPRAKVVPGRKVIIEPVMVVYLSVISVMSPLTSQYSVSVFNQRYNVSSSNATPCGEEGTNSSWHASRQAAQVAAAHYQTLLDVTQGVPTLFVALILGSFTDRIGRRIGLILPTVSAILRCLVFTLPQMTSSLPLEFTYLASLLDGLTGSDVIMVGTCYAYLSDVTSVERRSFRILLAELVQNAFKGVIHLGTGYAIAALGFLYPYLILMALHIVNLVYIVFFVTETRPRVPNQQIISKQLIIQPFRTVFRGRPGRGLFLLGLGGFFFLCFGQQGQFSVENLFLLNSPLCWGPVLLSYWKFTRIVIQCVTYVIVMKFLLPLLGDAPVVVISALSAIGYFCVFPFSVHMWIAFAALVVAFASKQNTPVAKVMLSKLTSSEEQGGIMAVTSVVERLCGILGNALFTPLYGATLLTFRGSVYMCFAALTSIGTALIVIFHVRSKRFLRRERGEDKTTSL